MQCYSNSARNSAINQMRHIVLDFLSHLIRGNTANQFVLHVYWFVFSLSLLYLLLLVILVLCTSERTTSHKMWEKVVICITCKEINVYCQSVHKKLTVLAASPQHAHTPKMLNTAEPTIVPTPISPFVMNVPITLVNSSGDEVAMAIKVAPATSLGRRSSGRQTKTRKSNQHNNRLSTFKSVLLMVMHICIYLHC